MAAVNQMTTLRLPDGQEVAFVDWNDKPLYSTADLRSGYTDETVEFFTYVPGDQVSATSNVSIRRTADESDTNLSTPGAMSSTEEMLVYAIRPEIFERQSDGGIAGGGDATTLALAEAGQPQPASQRLAAMHGQLMLSLRVSQKIMHRAGFGYWNGGNGVYNAIAGRATQGLPSQEAVRSLSVPIHIGGQEKYRVTVENPSGQAVLLGISNATPPVENPDIYETVRINLDGLYKRPVA